MATFDPVTRRGFLGQAMKLAESKHMAYWMIHMALGQV